MKSPLGAPAPIPLRGTRASDGPAAGPRPLGLHRHHDYPAGSVHNRTAPPTGALTPGARVSSPATPAGGGLVAPASHRRGWAGSAGSLFRPPSPINGCSGPSPYLLLFATERGTRGNSDPADPPNRGISGTVHVSGSLDRPPAGSVLAVQGRQGRSQGRSPNPDDTRVRYVPGQHRTAPAGALPADALGQPLTLVWTHSERPNGSVRGPIFAGRACRGALGPGRGQGSVGDGRGREGSAARRGTGPGIGPGQPDRLRPVRAPPVHLDADRGQRRRQPGDPPGQ